MAHVRFSPTVGFVRFFLLMGGCDALFDNSEPVATIVGIDAETNGSYLEIQDVSGRRYARVTSWPASIDVPITTDERHYLIASLDSLDTGFRLIETSDTFTAADFSGDEFVTSGELNATLRIR